MYALGLTVSLAIVGLAIYFYRDYIAVKDTPEFKAILEEIKKERDLKIFKQVWNNWRR